ncbi:MAG TPA: phosphoribosyltransferase family protein [Tepidisphaeraceae bacterium]|nr:phosphoribosyltransferase family protein [Tepidisphaeraceae bacterium]
MTIHTRPFRDRFEAGRVLAAELPQYASRTDVLVFALPRGGMPVAFEVARALRAALDVFVVRKLGAPAHEELAMGAIASGGIRVINPSVVHLLGITQDEIDEVARAEESELSRREREYRGDRPPARVSDRTVILIDDGLATGATMRAAAAALRPQHPAELVVAVPVAAAETCDEFRADVDRIVCAMTPEPFRAVGLWYENFEQTTDDEVRNLLERARSFPERPAVEPEPARRR